MGFSVDREVGETVIQNSFGRVNNRYSPHNEFRSTMSRIYVGGPKRL
jgi:hypothetical protein